MKFAYAKASADTKKPSSISLTEREGKNNVFLRCYASALTFFVSFDF